MTNKIKIAKCTMLQTSEYRRHPLDAEKIKDGVANRLAHERFRLPWRKTLHANLFLKKLLNNRLIAPSIRDYPSPSGGEHSLLSKRHYRNASLFDRSPCSFVEF
jgi:hypothetical protein